METSYTGVRRPINFSLIIYLKRVYQFADYHSCIVILVQIFAHWQSRTIWSHSKSTRIGAYPLVKRA